MKRKKEELLKDRVREEREKGSSVEDEENRENDRKWCSDSFSNCKNHC